MTIVLQGPDGVIEQAQRQLENLIPVWAVLDYTPPRLYSESFSWLKSQYSGPEVYEEFMQRHSEMSRRQKSLPLQKTRQELEEQRSQESDQGSLTQQAKEMLSQGAEYHPSRLAASRVLRHKHEHLEAITHLTHRFGGKVLNISMNNCIVEV